MHFNLIQVNSILFEDIYNYALKSYYYDNRTEQHN